MKRSSASCSQYQSEDRLVRLRKRASLVRISSSACLRCTNWPIWLPMMPIACSSPSSRWRTSRLLKPSTPMVRPSAITGNTNAPCMPVARLSCGCALRASWNTSETQSGCAVCNTRPESPSPGR
jgi:hypothetical protein